MSHVTSMCPSPPPPSPPISLESYGKHTQARIKKSEWWQDGGQVREGPSCVRGRVAWGPPWPPQGQMEAQAPHSPAVAKPGFGMGSAGRCVSAGGGACPLLKPRGQAQGSASGLCCPRNPPGSQGSAHLPAGGAAVPMVGPLALGDLREEPANGRLMPAARLMPARRGRLRTGPSSPHPWTYVGPKQAFLSWARRSPPPHVLDLVCDSETGGGVGSGEFRGHSSWDYQQLTEDPTSKSPCSFPERTVCGYRQLCRNGDNPLKRRGWMARPPGFKQPARHDRRLSQQVLSSGQAG